MLLSKKKLLTAIGAIALGSAGIANAGTFNFDITARTLPDVTLTEVTALSFGDKMFVGVGGVCDMNAGTPAAATVQSDSGAAAANYGDVSGTGCVDGTGTGTPGVYKVTGRSFGEVNVTINGVNGTSFDFLPNSGCIPVHNNAAGGDTCGTFTAGTAAAFRIAGGSDGAPAAAGELVFTVGGRITIGGTAAVALDPNQAYTENFSVEVTY